MSLRDHIQSGVHETENLNAGLRSSLYVDVKRYNELRARIHRKLLDRIDLRVMETMPADQMRGELHAAVDKLLQEETIPINETERRTLHSDIQHEVLGLGPLEPLMADPTVSDILVNTWRQVYVERAGQLELTDVRFENDAHLMKIIDKIVSAVGRRVDESSPMVDARLPDGSRVNAIIRPLAVDGPILSIRRFAVIPLQMEDLVRIKTLTPDMAELIGGLVKAKINLLISGGTGTGKTTMLNAMSRFIPASERIITIEDAAELQLQQPHVVRLETRPPNIEGKGEVPQRLLVRNSLRMRPDRIILGELRGAEAIDMLWAMNTGHEGSMGTIHANTPRDALARLEIMIGMAGLNLPTKAMRQQISSALTVLIQVARLSDGRRKVVSLQEITGMESDMITTQEIFAFDQAGVTADGQVMGHFRATGIRPKFLDKLRVNGIAVSPDLFDPRRLYE